MIDHQKIAFSPDRRIYYTSLQTKDGEDLKFEASGLEELINEIKESNSKEVKLKKPLLGRKYNRLFLPPEERNKPIIYIEDGMKIIHTNTSQTEETSISNDSKKRKKKEK